MKYWYRVDADKGVALEGSYRKLYAGHDVADAIAAWSKAVSDGEEYVMLEALREHQQ
jgi:hypothetical protein